MRFSKNVFTLIPFIFCIFQATHSWVVVAETEAVAPELLSRDAFKGSSTNHEKYNGFSSQVKARRKLLQSTSFIADCLAPHNLARAEVGLGPLTWNATVAVKAQEWSNVLGSQNRCLRLYHGGNQGLGQNLYGSSVPTVCSAAVNAWVDEKELYTYALFNPPDASGSSTGDWGDIGHYTQVVWGNTRQVGCAYADCESGGRVWTCDYYPPGNYIGQYPYPLRSPPPLQKKSPPPLKKKSPPPLKKKSPPPLKKKSPPPLKKKSPPPLKKKSPPPLKKKSPPPLKKKSPPPLKKKSPPPLKKKSPPPLKKKSPPPLKKKSPPPLKKKSPPPLHRKSPPPLNRKSPPPLKASHADCLTGHTNARAAVGVSALIWNDTVAADAQLWANTLASAGKCLNLQHGGSDEYGQNLFGASYKSTCTEAVASWVSEKQYYTYALFDPPNPSGSSTGDWSDIGHYTQVVWRDSKQLGCGTASCSNGGSVWACDYYPPGNYIGEFPY